ncbi:MAG: efflux RND transporter periplasmic adaptor subunit [Saprospiraceae bacterium]|nr:efflux RND transporter periplasmic adaptor subunit [Saprospiraceae bacterium]
MSLSKIIIPAVILVGLLVGAYFFLQPDEKVQEDTLLTAVKKGEFVITVTATGELKAKRSEKIRAPQGMRPAGIYETTIQNLIAEGTIVNEGDFVASLDRTELANKMSNVQTEIEKIQTQLEQAKIDTAIDLRGVRDQLINLGFTKKEKLLNVEQNKFEPESVIQQTQLDLERTERDYSQLLKNYELKKKQAIAKIQEIDALLRQNQRQLNMLSDLSDEFNIKAPKSGMVIYARNWNGKKEPGSRVSAWDPVVAELPDLSDMISQTYVNEVDISKVKEGQEVEIQVDAFPDNVYTGQVLQVANIGEQLRGYDAKVFEVIVQVNEIDSILRPAMTTSNQIVTDILDDVLFVPLEAIQNDSLTYVFKEDNGKTVRQEVITDLTNDDEIIIAFGLEEGDQIHMAQPGDPDDYPFVPLDPNIKEKIRKEQEEAEKARQAKAEERKKKMDKTPFKNDDSGGGDFMIIMD